MLAYERQELLSIRERLGSHPVFGGVHVARLVWFYVLCFVFIFDLRPVYCVRTRLAAASDKVYQ